MSKNLEKTNEIEKADGMVINEIMDTFKLINPTYYKLFGNKTQRNALQRLIDHLGIEKVRIAIKVASQCNGLPYAPNITTPLQLEDNLGKLRNFYAREVSKKAIKEEEDKPKVYKLKK